LGQFIREVLEPLSESARFFLSNFLFPTGLYSRYYVGERERKKESDIEGYGGVKRFGPTLG
jgi:hypothetical protein